MEGERGWAFSAPAFAAPPPPPAPASGASYLPAGWRKRRRRGRKQGGRGKRHRGGATSGAAGGGTGGAAPAPAASAPPASALQLLLPNPAQLAPLRCAWPHPAVLDLLAQQCWPAAGAAALLQRAAAAAAPPMAAQPHWWNRMLPSLSLLHPPLPERQHLQLLAARGGGGGGGEPQAQALPRPAVLVGYQEDWLEVPAEVLPLWQATPLSPYAGPKALLHYLLSPQAQLAAARQLVKDVGCTYETCNLGTHVPASSDAVRAFDLPTGGAGEAAGGAGGSQRYLAGLRAACERLQRELLVDPPPELVRQLGACLEEGDEPAVVVYLACPLAAPADRLAALLEAAACLAPCTPLGAAADASAGLCLLPHAGSGLDLAGCLQQAPLAPSEPQQADRPAGATPAADGSRGPGSSSPPEEAAAEEPTEAAAAAAAQQPADQQEQGQRYHGAASVLHSQQQGDFRRLPVRSVERQEGSRSVNIILQLLSQSALEDLSGSASRCTAYALYSKARHVCTAGSADHQLATTEPQEAAPPSLPLCSQPLVVLAPPAEPAAGTAGGLPPLPQQQDEPPLPLGPVPPLPPEPGEWQLQHHAQQVAEPSGSSGSQAQRTLHCFYAPPPPGCTLLPLAFADTCGELQHAELLDVGAGALGLADNDPCQPADEPEEAAPGSAAAIRTCRAVLRRCLALLGALRAASNPPGLLHGVAIAAAGMLPDEAAAWRRLVAQDAALQQLGLPPGAELAVLDLQALPPARFAGPDPPSGCQLVVQRSNNGSSTDGRAGGLQASITWLPPFNGAASLLPREHDVVRTLQVVLVCCGGGAAGAASASHERQQAEQQEEGSLRRLAGELHGLAWLHAAFQGACLQSLGGGGPAAPADAHLPLHAALGTELHALLTAATCTASV